jgi:hypothetical protein
MTEVVRLLSDTNIPNLATNYVSLRHRIVGEKMNELWNSWYSAPPTIMDSVMQQQWTVPQASFAQSVTWSDPNFELIREDNAFEQALFRFE